MFFSRAMIASSDGSVVGAALPPAPVSAAARNSLAPRSSGAAAASTPSIVRISGFCSDNRTSVCDAACRRLSTASSRPIDFIASSAAACASW